MNGCFLSDELQTSVFIECSALFYLIEGVNRSYNVFMLLTDVLISIFQSVEIFDRKVSFVLGFYVIVCLA